jgi:hypothetical protein
MDERYNIYFDGQVIAGQDVGAVREKLAKVFNADQTTLDKLFSGNLQLIKRGCDVATAQKFKAAMERAGAIPIIRPDDTAVTPAAAPPRAMSAAEKIAALAAAPDETRYQKTPATPAKAVAEEVDPEPGSIVLSPVGTEVLRVHERATPIIREVDTSGLAVAVAASRLSDVLPPPPPAPDTDHLSMGDVGELIPNLPSPLAPLSPDLDGLALSAPGTDFSDCAAPEPQAPLLDVSGLCALPPGTLPLEEEQRRQRIPVPVPATDHLAIED